MNKTDQKKFEKRAEIVKAMAHPSRLYIIDLLNKGEYNVQQITKKVGADISTVSRHLLVLKNAELVTCRKDGLKVWYKLNAPCIDKFFNCIEIVYNSKQNSGCTGECMKRSLKSVK